MDDAAGTLSICVLGTQKDVSIKLSKGSASYLHHIFSGETTLIPLTMGSGDYLLEARLYITPNAIEDIWKTTFSLRLSNELAPYLSASRIVNWSLEMALAKKAQSLVVAENSKATALAICGFIAKNTPTTTTIPLPPTCQTWMQFTPIPQGSAMTSRRSTLRCAGP